MATKTPANIRRKEFTARPNEYGTIEGYASTWDREPDSYGDIVARGAFTETLKEWADSGRAIPFLWSHRMDDIDSYIGTAAADEDDRGLHFIAKFDDTSDAQRVRQLYIDGRLAKFSFAYEILESAEVTLPDGRKANELQKVRLYEISAVTVPANSHAEVTDVKSSDTTEPKADDNKEPETTTEAINALIDVIKDATRIIADAIRDARPGDDTHREDPDNPGAEADDTKASAEDPDGDNAGRKAALLTIITKINKEAK